MMYSSEEILEKLVHNISAMEEVESIGISGSKDPLPKIGEGDIDIFIYCSSIPKSRNRQSIISQMGNLFAESEVNVFEGGHWGTGDFGLINGVETWLMYFTADETLDDVESVLNGDYPDKLDNYYYPTGRIAMLKNMSILYDKNNFLLRLKEGLSQYPEILGEILIKYHLDELDDTEDLERAVSRKDIFFYHFALDIALDHFLQALFAMNSTYFPSRKRTQLFIESFNIKPEKCSERLQEIIRFGSLPEGLSQSYTLWKSMVDGLKSLLRCDKNG